MGLIGGSLGLALKKNFRGIEVVGVVHQKKNIHLVLSKKAADFATLNLEEGIQGAKWIILATPPLTFETILKKLSSLCDSNQIIMDVGSVKGPVMESYRRHLKKRIPYLGAHPITGSEEKGIGAAQEDLFQGATCILTPDQNTSSKTLKEAKQFWKTLHALPVVKSAALHDQIFAYVSHLPHLISFGLAYALQGKQNFIPLSGQAWQDMTRIAHSSPLLWTEILTLNRQNVYESLRRFLQGLKKMEKDLQKNRPESIKKFFSHAQQILKDGNLL
ncbi:MAG: prephenate dehydrogenase [Chlamydiae bacterium]|nr:prephenate dehydrogenase [Chlamydiota bacterium]